MTVQDELAAIQAIHHAIRNHPTRRGPNELAATAAALAGDDESDKREACHYLAREARVIHKELKEQAAWGGRSFPLPTTATIRTVLTALLVERQGE